MSHEPKETKRDIVARMMREGDKQRKGGRSTGLTGPDPILQEEDIDSGWAIMGVLYALVDARLPECESSLAMGAETSSPNAPTHEMRSPRIFFEWRPVIESNLVCVRYFCGCEIMGANSMSFLMAAATEIATGIRAAAYERFAEMELRADPKAEPIPDYFLRTFMTDKEKP